MLLSLVYCVWQAVKTPTIILNTPVLAYADDIALIGKNAIEIRKLFVEMENIARKFGLQINQEKTKYMIVERNNSLKKNIIEHLKIKNYKF